MNADENKILAAISDNYKSLENPSFFFVQEALKTNAYNKFLDELRELLSFEETTDTNDDVSFCFLLEVDNSKWMLQLSMLGRFAILLKEGKITNSIKLVTEAEATSDTEALVLKLLTKHDIELVEKNLLEKHVDLKLQNTESENVCFFQALFSDVDVLPWR